MKPESFITTVRQMVSVTAVGPSALRGQGRGVLKASQSFLASLSLEEIPKSSETQFTDWLDYQTKALLDKLPVSGRPWGAARKAINLFLRDSLYNQYINSEYRISDIESWLEVPLDRAVAKGLKTAAGWGGLPPWPGLKHLERELSKRFQKFALSHAQSLGIDRVHLDMYLWLENR